MGIVPQALLDEDGSIVEEAAVPDDVPISPGPGMATTIVVRAMKMADRLWMCMVIYD